MGQFVLRFSKKNKETVHMLDAEPDHKKHLDSLQSCTKEHAKSSTVQEPKNIHVSTRP